MALEFVGPIIEIIKFIGAPMRKYWRYHRKLDEYVNTLKSNKEDLNRRREGIEGRLTAELHFGDVPNPEVNDWLGKARKMISEVQCMEDNVRDVKCLSRACFAKRVDKMTQEVIEVYSHGSFPGSLVINDSSNVRIPIPTSELVAETNVKEKIWEFLIGDSICMIGVWGMGGVGKTTIMKHIHNDLLNERKFEKVVWVTVSKTFDVAQLQISIANAWDEDLSNCRDQIIRTSKLFAILEKKRYVLILDDVWQGFSLENVGIPKPTVDNGCKLILTTRSFEVGQSMGCEVVKVQPLSGKEALSLFLITVGHDVLQLVPTLESTMKLVVEQCAGLPLAIVTTASTMKGEYDVDMWMDALNELKERARNVEDPVYEVMKFSYDRLANPKIQNCFLYCAMYPEDFEIPKEELIEYWIVEGFINERDTREAMHSKGRAILKKLENNCLLESTNDGRCVKMHDVVRDMALRITSQSPYRYFVKAGMELKELPNEQELTGDLEKVSLMENYTLQLSLDLNVKPPTFRALSTLLLKNCQGLETIDESFFELMIGLKILDLSGTNISCLPNAISNLEKLTALLLNHCWRLEYVPSLAKNVNLKKLDLGRTSIKEIPHGIEMLVQLRYLDLWVKGLDIPGGILLKLFRLQHLKVYKNKSFAKAEELAGLRKLENLEFHFYTQEDYHNYMPQPKTLQKYLFMVGRARFRRITDSRMPNATKYVIFGRCGISGDSIELPTDIRELSFWYCDLDVRSLSDISSLKEVTDLRRCQIDCCKTIESAFTLSASSTILESIEELTLSYLDGLRTVLSTEERSTLSTPVVIFSHLKVLKIYGCKKLEKLLWPELLQNLQNLEEIVVSVCSRLTEIAATSDDEADIKFSLPKLKSICLYHLEELKSICGSRSVILGNDLEKIEVRECPKLKRIPLLLPLQQDNGQPFLPPSFKKIKVHPNEWWESLEWDDPNTANLLQPFLEFNER